MSRYEAVWVARLLARKLAAVRGSVNPEKARPFFNTLHSVRGSEKNDAWQLPCMEISAGNDRNFELE